jgi:hypothetical protein
MPVVFRSGVSAVMAKRASWIAGRTWALGAGLLLAVAAGPAAAQSGWDNPPSPDARPKLQLNPYEEALKFKQQGNCVKAIELLEPLANAGHGYEVAQLNLGQCYIAVAETKQDADARKKDRLDGVKWIIKAADAGLAPAQEQLVELTLKGGWVKIEPPEAGKWYLLWKRNPARTQLGVSDLDPQLKQKLKTMLSDADWVEANKRANEWHPFVEPGEGASP